MAALSLPPAASVPSLPTEERARILDMLFEPSVPLHTLSVESLHEGNFQSYQDIIATVKLQLLSLVESKSTSDTEWLDKILGSHPRLGEKKVDSAQSKQEQAQLNQGGEEEAQRLKDLNRQYEETFPGLRYVVFVNGRSRPVIMDDMIRRIARGDIQLERLEAIQAMCDIAADRATKLSVAR